MRDGVLSLAPLNGTTGFIRNNIMVSSPFLQIARAEHQELTAIRASGEIRCSSDCSYLFYGCNGITVVSFLANWDGTSAMTGAIGMFGKCTGLVDLAPLSGWDMTHIVNASQMFVGCQNITTLYRCT